MRIAHRIDIVLFHQADILLHQFLTDSTSQLGMFVPVNTFHQYRYPIDTETAVLYFRSAEPHPATGYFGHLARSILQLQKQCIKIRMFRTPSSLPGSRFPGKEMKLLNPRDFTGISSADTVRPSASFSVYAMEEAFCEAPSIVTSETEKTIFIVRFFQRRRHFIISNIPVGSTIQIYIAFDSA